MVPDIAAVAELLAAWPQVTQLRVGYSGGVDSHVLLHILATHREALGGRRLAAVHVNHGLAAQAAVWEAHCAAVCRELGVALEVVRVDARPRPGESPEAAARRARYAAFAGLLRADTALLTAQHLDDQAETLLLQLLRGAGPRGLAAMPAAAPLGKGRLLRPFLEIRRDAITAYAQDHGLTWVEDASNADTRLDRNYLRHQVMSVLRRRWPAAAQTLGRSARLCADAAALLDDLADADLARAAGGRPDKLQLEALQNLDPPRRRNALRRWFDVLDLPPPAAVHLRHILDDVIAAPRDRQGRV
nr:tRNA lysidine(34) synthetase TilS [Pseudomonadota bacterium]